MSIKQKLEILKSDLNTLPVKIIAVTKYSTPAQIIEAYEAGLRDFGESKIQAITEKWPQLPDTLKQNSHWHFIGHLQTNKVKKVVGQFKLIHSVDSLKLAEMISEEAGKNNNTQDILLQVNISQEESKHGFNKEDILKTFPEITALSNLKISGLMTMAPFTEDTNTQRQNFRELRLLKELLQNSFNTQLTELSMGMSNDYKIAIEEGSTMIRIGQMLFS